MFSRASALVTLCIVYFGMGMGNAAMGPLLPALAGNAGLALSEAGLILSVAFFGGIFANLAGGPTSDRVGRGPVLLVSILIGCAALFGSTVSRSIPVLLGFMFLSGLGGSAVILSASAMVSDLFAERSVAALNLATLFFGVGAFAGPAAVSLSLTWWHNGMPALWAAAAFGVVVAAPLVAILTRRLAARPGVAPLDPAGDTVEAPGALREGSLLRSPLLWVFGAVLLLDVGTEQAVAAWTAVYMSQSAALALEEAALVVSGFWITFTLGRLGGAGIGSRWSSNSVLVASLATAAAGILLINVGTGHLLPSIFGFLLMGLGFGPVFPTIVALVGRTFGRSAGTAMGITMTLGTAGGMFFVWFEGILMAGIGPAAGVRLFGFTIVGIALLVVAARFLTRSAHPNRPQAG